MHLVVPSKQSVEDELCFRIRPNFPQMSQPAEQSRQHLGHKLISDVKLKLLGVFEVELLALADALANDFIESVGSASGDFVEAASELEVVGSKSVVAHGDEAAFGVHQPGLLRRSEVFSHFVDVAVAVLHERPHFGDLSFWNGPHCRETDSAVLEQEGAVDVWELYVVSSEEELLGGLEGEHGCESAGR